MKFVDLLESRLTDLNGVNGFINNSVNSVKVRSRKNYDLSIKQE